MNNIKSFNDFLSSQHLEEVVYTTEVNEGLRTFLNKKAQGKVRKELAEEIELSKSIMEGIKAGLESLSENFEAIKAELDKNDNKDKAKGESQKALESISKLIEDSKKSSWDLNDLIDEGEVDYAGFTANVGMANITYFGILLFPVRAGLIMHKGYNYFFTLIKNTIRKALVMLQLNFDQFENLIITKSFQSVGYMEVKSESEKVSEVYGQLQEKLFNSKTGAMKGKKGSKELEQQLKLVTQQLKQEAAARKDVQASESAYNCLDQYNNTYTKSLETLRQYTQEDVQKQLDAIKNAMAKLGGGDVDLTAYGELIIGTAEEHAYKVSSSIYSKFAKMTAVFSLPNQQKMIKLIQAATQEEQARAEKEAKKKSEEVLTEEKKKAAEEKEESGAKIFTDTEGVNAKLGERGDDGKYKDVNGSEWTYEKFKELDDDARDEFETWLTSHPEVLDKCDDTLKIAIQGTMDGHTDFTDYIESLIDTIYPSLESETSEAYVLNFDEFDDILEESKDEDRLKGYIEMSNGRFEKLAEFIEKKSNGSGRKPETVVKDYIAVKKLLIKKENKKYDDWVERIDKTLADDKYKEYVSASSGSGKSGDSDKKSEDKKSSKNKKEKYYLNLSNSESQIPFVKEMYIDAEDVATAALGVINDKIVKSKSFEKNIGEFLKTIKSACDDKKSKVSVDKSLFDILKSSIEKLKDEQSHDFPSLNGEPTKTDKETKSED